MEAVKCILSLLWNLTTYYCWPAASTL